jgi:flagellin-specific chaperone FliS
MSMSQEEIEALMSGLDIPEDDTPAEEVPVEEPKVDNETMSEDDIADLIAQTDIPAQEEEIAPIEEVAKDELVVKSSPEDNIDDIINNIEETPASEDASDENIEDILASIDGMDETVVEEVPKVEETNNTKEPTVEVSSKETVDNEAIAKDWTDGQIDQGVFPFPVEKNTKVVNQLSQVATDSEEKASKIFDVLSFILDENNDIQKNAKAMDEFLVKQIALLDSLGKKFPNIDAFKTNLELAQSIQGNPKDIINRTDAENTKLFEAMELMQFHDINRQKIERVMSVIKKLSTYLNGLFEDETDYHEVAVAKHIHGDSNSDLVDSDDLDALINEFSK